MEATKELPDFGDRSEYLHFLTAVDHAERSADSCWIPLVLICLEMNCEPNVHLNKILKGILVRLQGFSNRPLGNCGSAEENAILNHLAVFSKSIYLNFIPKMPVMFWLNSYCD